MRLSQLARITAIPVTVAVAIGVADAQTIPRPPAGAIGQPERRPPGAEGPIEVQAPSDVRLTPQQQLEEAQKYAQQMDQAAAVVRSQLEQARAANDVVKVLCLNDRLGQINVAIRSSRDRVIALRSAVARGDTDRAHHEFTVLQVLRDRVETLRGEASLCIGEEGGFAGEGEVRVEIDPNIPTIDPTDLGIDPGVILETPVLSSPVQ